MKLPVNDAGRRRRPASASERRAPVEERGGRRDVGPSKEDGGQIPLPMMLIFSALLGISRDK